jgi:hypothetical protein
MGIILGFWIVLRLFSGMLALVASTFRPVLPIEFQPIENFSLFQDPWLWFDRFVLVPWQRWDANWYLHILSSGYQAGNGTTQFHPLFIGLAKILSGLGFDELFSLMLVSSLSGVGFVWIFYRQVLEKSSIDQARFATLFLLVFPVSIVLFAPYTEALFLLVSASGLWAAKRANWGWAGLLMGLAVLTRQQGIFLVFPLFYLLWKSHPLWPVSFRVKWSAWAAFLWIPAAQLLWFVYRGRLGDLDWDFSSIQSLIYSAIISKSAHQVVPEQAFFPPWQIVNIVIQKLGTSPDLDLLINVVGGIVFIGLFFLAWPHLDGADRILCLVFLIVSFSYYTGPSHPLMGLLRHCYLAFPLFYGAAKNWQKPWQRLVVISISLVGMFILTFGYVFEAWVL